MGLVFTVVSGLLIAVASLVDHGLRAHRLSCPMACGIFPDRGLNPCPLHWQVDSEPLNYQGRLQHFFLMAEQYSTRYITFSLSVHPLMGTLVASISWLWFFKKLFLFSIESKRKYVSFHIMWEHIARTQCVIASLVYPQIPTNGGI